MKQQLKDRRNQQQNHLKEQEKQQKQQQVHFALFCIEIAMHNDS